ncbi:methyltransferase domain-containing protein [Myxococcota bacterium]|nr:methyltransferase domain-containing protein [Myxococcota bacterium]
MRDRIIKTARGVKRLGMNLACMTPIGRRLILPPAQRAKDFGPADAGYSWRLFGRQFDRLREVGYEPTARRILDVGPGRNIGSSLLWWAASGGGSVSVVLWDTYANMIVDAEALRVSAQALMDSDERREDESMHALLKGVAEGQTCPDVKYRVSRPEELGSQNSELFDLVLSHSCFEHIWDPVPTLAMLAHQTAPEGWHFVQIDLMDHGSRQTNYLEMLEWSDSVYWWTTRFIGGVNRWRAQQYVDLYQLLRLKIIAEDRRSADQLPIPRERLAKRFQDLPDRELLTTELVLITHGFQAEEAPADSA